MKAPAKHIVKKKFKIQFNSWFQAFILVVNVALLGVTAWGVHSFSTAPQTALASDIAPASANVLVDYSTEKLAKEQKNVLFFNARWCPHCKQSVKAFVKDADKVPSNIVIFDIDPDSAKNIDLVKKYNVVAYPTFVQVDDQGTMITKWTGETTPDTITQKVQ